MVRYYCKFVPDFPIRQRFLTFTQVIYVFFFFFCLFCSQKCSNVLWTFSKNFADLCEWQSYEPSVSRCSFPSLKLLLELGFCCSMWMCTWSLAVAMGAATLLPFSVIGSEIIQAYPGNYYFQWLNWSLIHSLWNYIFALSNLSLFILLPFAYFFIESQGFRGHGKVHIWVKNFCILILFLAL